MQFSWSEKIGLGLLIAAWLVFGANMLGNSLVSVDKLEKPAYQVATSDDAGEAKKSTEMAAEEDVLTMLASANIDRGAKVFGKCKACHTREEGGKNGVGPNLWEIVGRGKGSVDGYKYSAALQEFGGDWSYADLDAFLASPKTMIKKTKMSFAGVKKASDRAAIIVYLRSLSAAPKALP
jgi:cytochrome c